MIKSLEIAVSPEIAANPEQFKRLVSQKTGIKLSEINHINILKRSIDGRSKHVLIRLRVEVFSKDSKFEKEVIRFDYKKVDEKSREILIIGAGPAGLFAALKCLEHGLKPVILERGKSVSERKKDIAALSAKGILNENSNYCFGEGGAGTFSDGKLFTRSTKRGDVSGALKTLIFHGADENILVDAHPHIGSDKLPKIIQNIRETILSYGGEIRFNTQVCDFVVKNRKIVAVVDQNGSSTPCETVLLCTGHSANDIYEWFHKNNYAIEAKPFAMGVRVEHPQALIDKIQYHSSPRSPYLEAATYSLTAQVNGRGVFSFCMCPGGVIIPASTTERTLVVNGMSNSQRNSPFANSGIVVTVDVDDFAGADVASTSSATGHKFPELVEGNNPLSGLRFRESVEKRFFEAGGENYQAPAQKLYDFVKGKISKTLNESTYHRGLVSVDFNTILPDFITSALRSAFLEFDKKKRGFLTNDAMLIGLESRTSSPVRISRNEERRHPNLENLYPCGEGAGYAGGITSSAIDGVASILAIVSEQKSR
ncbi:MAG: NAD(P)/FAD-dependent oxidoreductase [Bacteroidales bacterium]|nr:NAD(P)/FAD-dependent oxidoreductase [Bacteroidales bacterium]